MRKWTNPPHLSRRRKRSVVERNSSAVCQVTERAGIPYHCRCRLLLPVGYYEDVLFLCFNYLLWLGLVQEREGGGGLLSRCITPNQYQYHLGSPSSREWKGILCGLLNSTLSTQLPPSSPPSGSTTLFFFFRGGDQLLPICLNPTPPFRS